MSYIVPDCIRTNKFDILSMYGFLLKIMHTYKFTILTNTLKASSEGRTKIENDIEESLLFAQFIINNTIAVQE